MHTSWARQAAPHCPSMIDTAEEASIISPQLLSSLLGAKLCALRKNDAQGLQLADGVSKVAAQGVAHLWLSFGNSLQVRHTFLVAPVRPEAILGSDFAGTQGSDVSYSAMTFKPCLGCDTTTPLRERDGAQPRVATAYLVDGRVAVANDGEQEKGRPTQRSFGLEQDTGIPPHSEAIVFGALRPTYNEQGSYAAVVEPTPRYKMENRGDNLGVGRAVIQLTPDDRVFTKVTNMSDKAIKLRKDSHLADVIPLDNDATLETVTTLDEARTALRRAQNERGMDAAEDDAPRAAATRSTSTTNKAERREVTDEELEPLLTDEQGQTQPALRGLMRDGTPIV